MIDFETLPIKHLHNIKQLESGNPVILTPQQFNEIDKIYTLNDSRIPHKLITVHLPIR
jgi:hypothetical protein